MLSVSGMLLLMLSALPGLTQSLPNQVPCSPAVQALARAALGHTTAAHDLPDFGLVAADRPILVSNFVSGLKCELQNGVLPKYGFPPGPRERRMSPMPPQLCTDLHGMDLS